MTAFRGKLSASGAGVVSGDSLATYAELSASMNIHTEVEITTTGSGTRNIRQSLSTQGTLAAFHEWQDDQGPRPAIAILKHYSSALHEIPRPTQQWTTQTDLLQAFRKMLFLEAKTLQLPRIENLPALLDGVGDLAEELNHINPHDVEWQPRLKGWSEHFRSQKRQVDDWVRVNNDAVLLRQLVGRAKEECPVSPWKE